jgi:bifunctional N-acetylglucosamine-1-phosphate-uridyltransferase/glucosamine-1-phosphate-acetyltransferase GlmU-like protein
VNTNVLKENNASSSLLLEDGGSILVRNADKPLIRMQRLHESHDYNIDHSLRSKAWQNNMGILTASSEEPMKDLF